MLATDLMCNSPGGLVATANQHREQKLQALRRVFGHADLLQENLVERLEVIAPDVTTALQRITAAGSSFVTRSSEMTDHYYRSQIIYNAKWHLKYFADTSDYRSWVSLNMVWERKARLVFAFHGIGRPFSGSLVCAPFLEFRDTDDEGHVDFAVTPVAEEAFVFFYKSIRNQGAGSVRALARRAPNSWHLAN